MSIIKKVKEKNDTLFGFHSVYEALKADRRKIYNIFFSPQKKTLKRFKKIEKIARRKNIKIEKAAPDFFDKMTGSVNHQGVIAKTSFFPVGEASEVITLMKQKQSCFILIMDSIEDPHNLGALIRTALCAGVDYILIPKDRSARPSSAVSRSSAGAMEHAKIFMVTNTAATLRSLKENNAWISGLDANGDTSLFDSDLTGSIVLVIGGEHKGIRPGVRKECDFLLSIPNRGDINSLNASVAGGIAMFEALRQRS